MNVKNKFEDFSLTNMLTHELNFIVKSDNDNPDLPPSELRNTFKIDILIDLLLMELRTFFTDRMTDIRFVENLRKVSYHYVETLNQLEFISTVSEIFNDLGIFKLPLDISIKEKTIDLIYSFISSIGMVAKLSKQEVKTQFATTIKIDDELKIKIMEN